MSYRTLRIIFVCALLVTMISFFFPYERFNIAIKWATIIRIVIASVALGVGIRLLVLYSRSPH
jgi:hypothetical protein